MQQLPLPFETSPAFEAKDFIVSASNEDAYRWLMKWPDWPKNIVSIYGEKGCGKTHLSYIWEQKSKARRLAGSDFGDYPMESLLVEEPRFILDEAQVIKDEEKLLHFYNHVAQNQGELLMLSEEPPARWDIQLPDLKSRLSTLPALKIQPPDEALLEKVLHKLFADVQAKVDESVIAFLLKHMERSFASAHMWVEKLNKQALIQKRNITIPLVRESLLPPDSAEKH